MLIQHSSALKISPRLSLVVLPFDGNIAWLVYRTLLIPLSTHMNPGQNKCPVLLAGTINKILVLLRGLQMKGFSRSSNVFIPKTGIFWSKMWRSWQQLLAAAAYKMSILWVNKSSKALLCKWEDKCYLLHWWMVKRAEPEICS